MCGGANKNGVKEATIGTARAVYGDRHRLQTTVATKDYKGTAGVLYDAHEQYRAKQHNLLTNGTPAKSTYKPHKSEPFVPQRRG